MVLNFALSSIRKSSFAHTYHDKIIKRWFKKCKTLATRLWTREADIKSPLEQFSRYKSRIFTKKSRSGALQQHDIASASHTMKATRNFPRRLWISNGLFILLKSCGLCKGARQLVRLLISKRSEKEDATPFGQDAVFFKGTHEYAAAVSAFEQRDEMRKHDERAPPAP